MKKDGCLADRSMAAFVESGETALLRHPRQPPPSGFAMTFDTAYITPFPTPTHIAPANR